MYEADRPVNAAPRTCAFGRVGAAPSPPQIARARKADIHSRRELGRPGARDRYDQVAQTVVASLPESESARARRSWRVSPGERAPPEALANQFIQAEDGAWRATPRAGDEGASQFMMGPTATRVDLRLLSVRSPAALCAHGGRQASDFGDARRDLRTYQAGAARSCAVANAARLARGRTASPGRSRSATMPD